MKVGRRVDWISGGVTSLRSGIGNMRLLSECSRDFVRFGFVHGVSSMEDCEEERVLLDVKDLGKECNLGISEDGKCGDK